MSTDKELLLSYAEDGSEGAFTELVERYVKLVYSAAIRESQGDSNEAQDLTQAVFTGLARNAKRLAGHPALAGWLYTSVRFTAANLRRAAQRRLQREHTAYVMNQEPNPDPPEPLWRQVRPVLDDAMHELNQDDRTVVVLRFFEERSLKDVGEALGLNENAARMRVERTLEKLQGLLAKRGINSTAGGLAAVLTAGMFVSVPSGLAASVASAALAGAATTTSTAITLLQVLTMTKIQTAIVGAVLVGAVALPVWQQTRLGRLSEENRQLQTQVGELAALKTEVARLQTIEKSKGELERLRASDAQLRTELAGLRGRLSALKRNEAQSLLGKRPGDQAQDEAGGTNQFGSAMSEMMKVATKQQALGQLERMKAKLNLSAEQEQQIREILLKQADTSSQAVQKMFTGKFNPDEIGKISKAAGNPEEQIKQILTPEQLDLYTQYKQDEAAGNARLAANAEMLQMQTALGLSPEQQDKVYNVLYDQTLSQMNGKIDPPAPSVATNADPVAAMTQAMTQALERKAKALESVLTPAQVEKYRELQSSQLDMIKTMVSPRKQAAAQTAP